MKILQTDADSFILTVNKKELGLIHDGMISLMDNETDENIKDEAFDIMDEIHELV